MILNITDIEKVDIKGLKYKKKTGNMISNHVCKVTINVISFDLNIFTRYIVSNAHAEMEHCRKGIKQITVNQKR